RAVRDFKLEFAHASESFLAGAPGVDEGTVDIEQDQSDDSVETKEIYERSQCYRRHGCIRASPPEFRGRGKGSCNSPLRRHKDILSSVGNSRFGGASYTSPFLGQCENAPRRYDTRCRMRICVSF